MFRRFYCQLANAASTAAEWHNVPIVSTTSFPKKSLDGTPYIGVYWGHNDPMNLIKPCTIPNANIFHASIESVLTALRQAIHERKLDRVVVQTDSDYIVQCANRYLHYWRRNDFTKKNGEPVKNRQEIQDLDIMLNMINAKVQNIPNSNGNNMVLKRLQDEPAMVAEYGEEFLKSLDPKAVAEVAASDTSSREHIYVASRFVANETNRQSSFNIASFGIIFEGNPIMNDGGRFAQPPVTHFRAQMAGLIQALTLVKEKNMKHVHVVTDNPVIVKYFRRQWLKADGTRVANGKFYDALAKLAEEVDATIGYVTSPDNKTYQEAVVLAQDALSYPVLADRGGVESYRDPKPVGTWISDFKRKYEEGLQETASEWVGVPVVHVLSTESNQTKICTLFDDQKANNEQEVQVSHGNMTVTATKMLNSLLQKCIERKMERIIIRSNSNSLPFYIQQYIPRWETNGYVTKKGTPVVGKAVFQELHKLMQQIQVRLEMCQEAATPEDERAFEFAEQAGKELSLKVGA